MQIASRLMCRMHKPLGEPNAEYFPTHEASGMTGACRRRASVQARCCLIWLRAPQVDTKDILFICGGAFIDLDRQVAERTATSSIGFGNPVR